MSALLLPLPFKPSVKTDVNNSVSATILHSGEMALNCLWRRSRLQKATKGYKLDIITTLYNVRTPRHPLADERKLSFDFYNTFCNNFNLDWQEIVKKRKLILIKNGHKMIVWVIMISLHKIDQRQFNRRH